MKFAEGEQDGVFFQVLNEDTKEVVAICTSKNNAIVQARYWTLCNEGKTPDEAKEILKQEGLEWD